MANDIFIHVGYPKAASTTLQKGLFDKHKGLFNLGVFPRYNLGEDSLKFSENNLFLKDEKVQKFHTDIGMLDDFDFSYTETLKLWQTIEKKYLENTNLPVIISNERFNSAYFSYSDMGVKAKRLKFLFPKARIILVIRNQFDIIKSQYRDHPFSPRHLGIGKPLNLNKWVEVAFKHQDEVAFVKHLDYYRMIKYYEGLFGEENICVLLFEELVKDTNAFSEKLSHFMNIDKDETVRLLSEKKQNSGVSGSFNSYRTTLRSMKQIIPQAVIDSVPAVIKTQSIDFFGKLMKRGGKAQYNYNAKAEELIYDYYKNSNLKLQTEKKLKLSKYGYPIEK